MFKKANRYIALALTLVMLMGIASVLPVSADGPAPIVNVADLEGEWLNENEHFEDSGLDVTDATPFGDLLAKKFVSTGKYTVPQTYTEIDNNGTLVTVPDKIGSHNFSYQLSVPATFSADATGLSFFALCGDDHDFKNMIHVAVVYEDDTVETIDDATTVRGRVTRIYSKFPSTVDPSKIKGLVFTSHIFHSGKIADVLSATFDYTLSNVYENNLLPEIEQEKLVRNPNREDGLIRNWETFDDLNLSVPNFWTITPTLEKSDYFKGIPGFRMTGSVLYDGTKYTNCVETYASFEVKEDLSVYDGLQFYAHFDTANHQQANVGNEFTAAVFIRINIGSHIYGAEAAYCIESGVTRCRIPFETLSLITDLNSALEFNRELYKFDESMVSQISDIQLYFYKGGTYEPNVTKDLGVDISDIYGYTKEKDFIPSENIYNFVVPATEVVDEELVAATKAAFAALPELNKPIDSYTYEDYQKVMTFAECYGSASYKTLETINNAGITDDIYGEYFTLMCDLEVKVVDLSSAVVKVSPEKFVYNGKPCTPKVTATLYGTPLTQGVDYTLTYINNNKAGTATVKLTGVGGFKIGEKTATFVIEQKVKDVVSKKKVSLGKLTSKKRTVTVKWKKLKGATGYKIVYGYTKALKKGTKTVTVKKANATSTVIKKLKKGKKVYVKICAYQKLNSKTVNSKFSKVKNIKVK